MDQQSVSYAVVAFRTVQCVDGPVLQQSQHVFNVPHVLTCMLLRHHNAIGCHNWRFSGQTLMLR